jgi:hypothetical protein
MGRDFDHDGRADLYISEPGGNPLYRSRGSSRYQPAQTAPSGG